MALMQRMRDNTHVILWALLILFLASRQLEDWSEALICWICFPQKSRLKDAAGIVNVKS
jgi:hypothetical protein